MPVLGFRFYLDFIIYIYTRMHVARIIEPILHQKNVSSHGVYPIILTIIITKREWRLYTWKIISKK